VLELHKTTPNPDEGQIWDYINKKYNIGHHVGGKKYVVYCYPSRQTNNIFRTWEECVGITVFTAKQDQATSGARVLEPGLHVYVLGMEPKFTILALLMKRKSPGTRTAKYLEVVLWIPQDCLDVNYRDLPWSDIPNEEWIRVVEIGQLDYSRTFSPETYEGFCDADEWETINSLYAEIRVTFRLLKLTPHFRFPEHLIPKSQRGSAPRPVVPGEDPDTEAHDSEVEPEPPRAGTTEAVPEPKPKRSRKSTDPYSPLHQMREDKRRSEVLRMSMGSGKKRKVSVPKAKKQSRVKFASGHEDYKLESEYETEYEEPVHSAQWEPEPGPEPSSRTTKEPRVVIRTSDFATQNLQTTNAPLFSQAQLQEILSHLPRAFPVPMEEGIKDLINQNHAEIQQKMDTNLRSTTDSNQNVITQLKNFGTIITVYGTEMKSVTAKLDSLSSEQTQIKESIMNLRTEIRSLRTVLENQGSTFTMEDIQTMEQRRDKQEKALIDQLKSFISMILPGQFP